MLKFSKDGNETLLKYGINKQHYLVTNRFLVGLNLVYSALKEQCDELIELKILKGRIGLLFPKALPQRFLVFI